MTTTSEALVIGGGPVGLFAALSLLERGISVEVLDAAGERAVRGYACGLHPRTLSAFERAGVMPAILQAGHRVDRWVVHSDRAELGRVEFESLGGKYPYALTLSQFELEEVLEQALTRRDLEVHRHHAVSDIHARDGIVTVTGATKPPGTAKQRSDASSANFVERRVNYVIGADGYFSVCRRMLGVDLTRMRPTRAFAVCEFMADLRGWERAAHTALSMDGTSAFWPLGPELGRFTFQIWKDLDQTVSLDVLHELIRERAPWFTPKPEQLCWGAVAPFEHRVVRRFGVGRVWLVGDAAHSTSPIGFQSMNRGFCEADQLSDLIASALFDEDHRSGMFERFEHDQQAEWMRLFGLRPATLLNQDQIATCVPASGEDFEALTAQLSASISLGRM